MLHQAYSFVNRTANGVHAIHSHSRLFRATLERGKSPSIRRVAVLESPKQTVLWYSKDGEDSQWRASYFLYDKSEVQARIICV
jgi:hypothetical protein